MTLAGEVAADPEIEAVPTRSTAHRITVVLAGLGVPILAVEAWTVGAWLKAGPRQLTADRTHSSTSWYAAHTLEAITVAVGIAVVVHLVRDCRRQRRLLTFDVMFCMAAGSMFWANSACNFFHPTFLVSSNFVGLTNPCGNIPFVQNHGCGSDPDPTLFLGVMETFGILGIAIVATKLAGLAWRRWPAISTTRMVVFVLLGGILVDLGLEPLSIALKLWDYPAPGWMSLHIGGLTYPVVEILAAGLWFGALMAVRVIRTGDGLSLVESRGPGQAAEPRWLSLLALYGYCQLLIWVVASIPLWALGHPSLHGIPAQILNGAR